MVPSDSFFTAMCIAPSNQPCSVDNGIAASFMLPPFFHHHALLFVEQVIRIRAHSANATVILQ
jgi:hypothetical protein